MTTTVYVSIGNSDDKLSQYRWSKYAAEFVTLIRRHATRVHGEWFSRPDSQWQNACMAFEIAEEQLPELKRHLTVLRESYFQDSIAWAPVAGTEFI